MRQTSVGNGNKACLKLEIDRTPRGSARHAGLKEELKEWNKCEDDDVGLYRS